ncbi:hypothetical protein K431DRAFT_299587 [Polychaeton citri CBS 116435]|uniref:RNI-like protein n=1 Tax=Polychaeton citri CBS 116435 TaxID=1314669 RepID=A0A9P4QHH2_9PEZI|nr:hypothetical protein K431DRAFT_299587 [Polychaeton citri CBS 116435]
MEQVHGVDVSWLHQPNKQGRHHTRNKSTNSAVPVSDLPQRLKADEADGQRRKRAPSAPGVQREPQPRAPAHAQHASVGSFPPPNQSTVPDVHSRSREGNRYPAPSQPAPPKVSDGKDRMTALPAEVRGRTSTDGGGKGGVKRPGLLGRSNSKNDGKDNRRPSWINNLSSRFSGSQAAAQTLSSPAATTTNGGASSVKQGSPASISSSPLQAGSSVAAPGQSTPKGEEIEPYVPAKPKEQSSSFFSSLTRRLSSQNTTASPGKVPGNGGVCPRKVLNVDPNRPRCLVPELDPNKLRRVSFCVDVEVAGHARYYTEDVTAEGVAGETENDDERRKKKRDIKMKEKAEGAAMRNPELMHEMNDDDETEPDAKSTEPKRSPSAPSEEFGTPPSKSSIRMVTDESPPQPIEQDSGVDPFGNLHGSVGPEEEARLQKKREKKQKSETERKQRRDNKRRRAEEQGLTPVEMRFTNSSDDSLSTSQPDTGARFSAGPGKFTGTLNQDAPESKSSASRQDRPTTDPVRIYRRCCQLRETPILKRITEQLMSPKIVVPGQPGVVACLDLTGSRLQLADFITLGDWLAVVPVKRLLLEDADMNDEGIRVVLAGLLAAKRPEPTRRREKKPMHREGSISACQGGKREERSGVVEKISFKNNPRLTRVAWKYFAMFLYMCRSIKAIDVSMNQFPENIPASAQSTSGRAPQIGATTTLSDKQRDADAAAMLYRCLAERDGKNRLEELSVSECGLNANQVRRIVDGAIMCGISRLGLAGNNLDDESLTHVIHYLRSGVCQGLDLGANDLGGGKLTMVAESLLSSEKISQLPIWGLSLAGCNLSPVDVKMLFPAMVKLPDFRFIDLSHNPALCAANGNPRVTDSSCSLVGLLRRYIPQMKSLKRIHLVDVGMEPKQLTALADVLPEGPQLAHVSLLENAEITKVANSTDEAGQEEACAVYASLTAAVRCSQSLVCIDIDVPNQEANEVVKALAKQVVAYCLRNMESFALTEASGAATSHLTDPHGGKDKINYGSVPDVLWHLVGHIEGNSENHDNDPPAPGKDYIVGGAGVVKALQYVLGEKANDLARGGSNADRYPNSGTVTPKEGARPGSSASFQDQKSLGKAKEMSKYLLESARNMRSRLQPALAKEAEQGDEMSYRRLLFLDQTLEGIIARFEEEYPEVCVRTPYKDSAAGKNKAQANPQHTGVPLTNPITLSHRPRFGRAPSGIDTSGGNAQGAGSDSSDEDGEPIQPGMRRHNSDVSIANRTMTTEEGHLHRLGQHLRRDIVDSPSTPTFGPSEQGDADVPNDTSLHNTDDALAAQRPVLTPQEEQARLRALGARIESLTGDEIKSMVVGNGVQSSDEGWQNMLERVGANFEDLRLLQEQDPKGWEEFKEAHMKARANVENPRPGSAMGERDEKGRRKRQGMIFG